MTLLQAALDYLKRRGIEWPAKPITFAYQLIKREKDMQSKDKGEKPAKKSKAAARGPVGHWPNLMAPPTFEQAMDGLKAAYDALTGGDKLEGAYGAEIAVMFGTAQIPHDEHNPVFAVRDVTATDEDHARQVLEGALAMHGQAGGDTASRDVAVLPWGTIISVLLPLLLKWLSNRAPANA
jgi:hypothetical protein